MDIGRRCTSMHLKCRKQELAAGWPVIKANLQSMQDMMQTMRAIFDAKTPVERLDAHLAAMEAQLKALTDVKPFLAKLYEALSADQKKKADDLLTAMGCMM
jgi:hypothetical protein